MIIKECVFILPYFGKFNNYFTIFLKSCKTNPNYDWLIFTDCEDDYNFPDNVHKILITLEDIKKIAEDKFGFSVCLKTPHKLCDYKPAYGYLFEEYIREYPYWGHCDCDLVFGNLEKLLTPLLKQGFDKLFAAGHLTIYKNTYENNRRFMKTFHNRILYRQAYTTDTIFVMDEDCAGHDNVHTIFREDGTNIYETDLSVNPSISSAKFIREYYEPTLHEFIKEDYIKARYFWIDGSIVRVEWNKTILKSEFLYLHLQMRRMRMKHNFESNMIEILPDRFVSVDKIPGTKSEMRLWQIGIFNLYWYDVFRKKIARKLNLMRNKLRL